LFLYSMVIFSTRKWHGGCLWAPNRENTELTLMQTTSIIMAPNLRKDRLVRVGKLWKGDLLDKHRGRIKSWLTITWTEEMANESQAISCNNIWYMKTFWSTRNT
jgi:hypothetical protein